MAKSVQFYNITGSTLEDVMRSLQFHLTNIGDRLDRIEGIRGTASIASALVMNKNKVTGLADGEDDQDAATISNTRNFKDRELDRAMLKDYGVKHQTAVSVGGVLTIDMTAGNSVFVELFENITSIVIENPPPSGYYGQLRVRFGQNSTGGWAVSGWPTTKWESGTAPTITTTASTARDIILLETDDVGASYDGYAHQDHS
ncbi:MAG: hypothetical protein IH914_10820 [candidate division Zixibacteria bacterium]|nr:hypothetical protein [candidate division Zixibacteria bacterium]